jgi:transposase, IS30 family
VAKAKWLTADEIRLIRKLVHEGYSYRQIGARLGRSPSLGRVIKEVRSGGPIRLVEWCPGRRRLSLSEREEIHFGLAQGESFSGIASRLGRSVSTVSREVNANGGRNAYRPSKAYRRAFEMARRPKTSKLADHRPLRAMVEEWLEEWWSPEQIARRLRCEFPDDPMMWVSHETIYQAIYVQGRGSLRRELARCLRSGRAQRRPRSRMDDRRGRIPDMVLISDRPVDVEDRAVPGHWEGDLIVGQNNKSAIATLVERSTRYVMLAKIEDHTAITVRKAIAAQITGLPAHLRRSLTWDQGREMSEHLQFTVDTNIDVYFCDPHSPWQRGSNENTNGLLRQYFPKGTDLSVHSQDDLDRAATSLNNRPRETLGWLKPSEKLTELLVAATL